MTLKIEVNRGNDATTIQLIGRVKGEHVDELERLMRRSGSRVCLDLGEVSLVDAEVVRFLAGCSKRGIQLLRCPAYVSEWIAQHQRGDR